MIMTLEETQAILNTKKRGQFLTITYQKVLGDYKKTTTTTIRLVDYNNVKAVKEMKKAKGIDPSKPLKSTITGEKKPSADKHLGNNLIYNENTHKTRLQVFLTNHHTPHVIYEYQGHEIDQEQWYAESGDKKSTPSIMFSITIDNILAIK